MSCEETNHSNEYGFNEEETIERIKEQINAVPVILYMKGTPDYPLCGFSQKAVAYLKEIRQPFAYINILEDPAIREALPKFADWATFPQLWVNGQLVGGCDIMEEMYQSGELREILESIEWKDDDEYY